MIFISPIHVDVNAHQTDYEDLADNELKITSIFRTIQGEGPFAGTPAVFVRLAGCNFGGKGTTGPGCIFCDTDFRLSQSRTMSFAEIYQRIDELRGRAKEPLVVITGGEPLLQRNLRDFILQSPHYLFFQIETNGTQYQDIPRPRCAWVVSPKIVQRNPNSNKERYGPLNKKVLKRARCLKFIISADPDNPYFSLPPYAFEQCHEIDIYLSPMNVYKRSYHDMAEVSIWDPTLYNYEQCAANHAYAAKLALQFDFKVSTQQHLFLAIP